MKHVTLNNQKIPLKIIKKNNKHTYFYFDEPGIIKVHLSKLHKPKFAVDYIMAHSNKFYNKFVKNLDKSVFDNNQIYKFGQVYDITYSDIKTYHIDEAKLIIHLPKTSIDQSNNILLKIQKYWMENYVKYLIGKYQNNPFVDISNLSFRYSFMTSRYGSCNASKRKVHLNLHLLKLDKSFTEYIFLHEISHLKVQNHSQDFYAIFKQLCPNYKEFRKSLKNIKLW